MHPAEGNLAEFGPEQIAIDSHEKWERDSHQSGIT
jgi:hypothetical protein